MKDTRKRENESVRLAAAILIRKGQISLADIAALPHVHSTDAAEKIARRLMAAFKTMPGTRSLSQGEGTLSFEDVIVLKGFKQSSDWENCDYI